MRTFCLIVVQSICILADSVAPGQTSRIRRLIWRELHCHHMTYDKNYTTQPIYYQMRMPTWKCFGSIWLNALLSAVCHMCGCAGWSRATLATYDTWQMPCVVFKVLICSLLQLLSAYLAYCGIAIHNAMTFESYSREYDRNTVCTSSN